MTNPILDEIRATRERLLSEAGGTLAGLVVRLQQEERVSNRKFIKPNAQSRNIKAGFMDGAATSTPTAAAAPTANS